MTVTPPCTHALLGTGTEQTLGAGCSPGTSAKHPGLSHLHLSVSEMAATRRVPTPVGRVAPLAWQSRGGQGEGTGHPPPPRVTLRWDPGEQGLNLLCLCREIAGTGKRLNLKKKKVLFQDLPFFFLFLFLLVFQKKWGKSTKNVSCRTAKV